MADQDYAAKVRAIRAALTYAVAFEHGRAGHAQDPNTCDVPLCATERKLSEALLALAAPAPSEPGLDVPTLRKAWGKHLAVRNQPGHWHFDCDEDCSGDLAAEYARLTSTMPA